MGRIRPVRPRLLPTHRRLVQRHRARVLPHHRLPHRPDDPQGPHHLRDGRDPLPLHRPRGLRRPRSHLGHADQDRRAHAALDLQGEERGNGGAGHRRQGHAGLRAHQRGRHAELRGHPGSDAQGDVAVRAVEPPEPEHREGAGVPPRKRAGHPRNHSERT